MLIADWFFVGFWFWVGAVAASFVIVTFITALLGVAGWLANWWNEREERKWREEEAKRKTEERYDRALRSDAGGPLEVEYNAAGIFRIKDDDRSGVNDVRNGDHFRAAPRPPRDREVSGPISEAERRRQQYLERETKELRDG